MDYTRYLLTIEFVVLAGFIVMWWVKRRHPSVYSVRLESRRGRLQAIRDGKGKKLSGNRPKVRRGSNEAAPAGTSTLSIKQTAMHVPIPWGWPHYSGPRGNRMEKSSISQSMSFLVESLIREKQLNTSTIADPRIRNSMRALIEGRYAPVDQDRVNAVTYYKTKPPLLRDPSEPHDQMDNFGRREAERISNKLKPVSAVKVVRRQPGKAGDFHDLYIGETKRPWGW